VTSLPHALRRAGALHPVVLQTAAALGEGSLELARLRARLHGAKAVGREWDPAVRAARVAALGPDLRGVEDRWQDDIRRGERGVPAASAFNAGLIIRHWPPFETLRLNRLTLEAELHGSPITDGAPFRWREQIERTYGVVLTQELMEQALETVAEERSFHPVKDYLDGLTWDGVGRLGRVPAEVLDATATPLHVRFIRCFFVAAVARVYAPGAQVDTILCLISGAQGRKKTTFFRVVAGAEWSAAGHIDPKDKDSLLKAHQQWVQVLDEVDELTRRLEWPAMKRWVGETADVFRAPYARRPRRHRRGFVFGATTNEEQFMHDPSGSRRFHVLPVGGRDPEGRMDLLRSWRDQLWAEAKEIYLGGTMCGTQPPERYLWWLTPEEELEREGRAAAHHERGVVDDKLEAWLARKGTGAEVRMVDVLTDALGVPDDRASGSKGMEREAGRVMRRLGWEQGEASEGPRGRVWRRRA
jgi:putative DNA primase/helicase